MTQLGHAAPLFDDLIHVGGNVRPSAFAALRFDNPSTRFVS
jgi:hypothetical protein